jgi:hypothetical protein
LQSGWRGRSHCPPPPKKKKEPCYFDKNNIPRNPVIPRRTSR